MSTLCLLTLLLATADSGAKKTVWLLEQPGWQREETALLEALLMYTRDLRVPITISVSAVEAGTAQSQPAPARAARPGSRTAEIQCTSGASLVLWFSGGKTAPSLSAYRCGQSVESQMRLVPVDDMALAAQTLALKLRRMIAELPERAPRQALPLAKKAGPGDAAVLTSSGQNPTVASAPKVWELGLAYSVLAASADSGPRQGATLRLGRSLAPRPLAIEVDGTLASSVVKGALEYRVSVSDLPLGLGMSARWQRARWLLAGGPRTSLHYVIARGSSPDGRLGDASTFAVGLGALGQMRYELWDSLGLGLALSSEIILPRQRFTVDNRYPVGVGLWQLAVAVGVVYSY